MRILHVCNHFHPFLGGIEKNVEDMCLELMKRGHVSDVCCLDKNPDSKGERLNKFEKYKGINIHRIPSVDLRYYKISPKVLNVVKKYDIIHIHGLGFFLDFLSTTKKIHGKPLILSTHGGIFHTKKLLHVKKIYFNVWSRYKLRKVTSVIAVSKNDEKLFSKISKSVVYIPDGIDYKKYSKIKRSSIKNTFLTIGRISPNKRIDRVIEIIVMLRKKIPDVRLYIVGKDWKGHKKTLEKMISEKHLSENVVFTGPVSDKEKIDLLSRCEFFVSASEYEGFGISVIEAMASGIPVIVNSNESYKNFVKNNENGYITDFSDMAGVARMIMEIDRNDITKISTAAKETAEKFSWEKIVDDIEKTYKKSV